ncbi:TIGR01621 family pseudouridine synthase [Psychrobium sp. 1_MG-2023]|uniref:TIGR01621 family pseudouridine synthase n=1 Tax=Psychrobium sp. 1_MG-2023 TaxID=3062624 RepID=UPI000C33B16F|nr:TIGR01621 family pseudouridine synthase [Psychrobium sp. 1_MG-2023]MDP2561235.1 TIGR01621 family pseudouridine synthase [Psychrobium sp. 1_MG-2023]PKF55262.1 TIGR01621 family pseudouridine synthase [Alteromonadales bacterium alter-6D02]
MINAFDIIDDNDRFIVINKYNDIDFHTSNQQLGIVELVKQQLGYSQLFPVHRLDKMTSGLLILAKDSICAAAFGELFEQRKMHKYYIALSDKKPKKKQGLIKGDMTKGRNGSYLLLKTTNNPALTQFFSYSINCGLRLFLLKPHSGKTHQLRVAMKSLGAPIIGDSRYYPGPTEGVGYLHAWKLSFELFSQKYHFTAQPRWCEYETAEQWLLQAAEPDGLAWPRV